MKAPWVSEERGYHVYLAVAKHLKKLQLFKASREDPNAFHQLQLVGSSECVYDRGWVHSKLVSDQKESATQAAPSQYERAGDSSN